MALPVTTYLQTNETILMKFVPHILYNYSYSVYQGLFKISTLIVFLQKKLKKTRFFISFRKIFAILLFLQK